MRTVYIYLNNWGHRFKLRCLDEEGNPVDISDATVTKMMFIRSDNVALERNALFLTDGSDGRIYYDTIPGDISIVGTWRIQGHIESPNGHWDTSIATFVVLEPLNG